MRVNSLLIAGSLLLAATTGAQASGFQVNLVGARNIGMASTGTGLYMDAASQFYNPGAFAFAPTGVQVSGSLALPRLSFRSAYGEQATLQNTNVFPFSGFVGFGPKEGKFRIGFGAYTPFGSELHYQPGWAGRYSLTDITLQSVFVQATAAYAITPFLSIGGGLVWDAFAQVNLQRDIPLQGSASTQPAHATLTGNADKKFGYNLGIMLKPSDKFSVGLSYRSAIDQHVGDGNISFTGVPASAAGNFTATGFATTLRLPDVFSVGLGIRPSDKLTIGLDANYVRWSRYQVLLFDYTGGTVGGATSSVSQRQYQDALAFRAGLQYKITNGFSIRGGAFYDMHCVKDGFITPETPDADRVGLSAGLSYEFASRFGIDASFLFEDFMQRSQTQQDLLDNGTTDRLAGTYKTTIVVPGVGLHFNF